MAKYYKKVWGTFSSPILDAQNYANYVTDTNIADIYKLFDGNTGTYVYLGSSSYYINLKFPNEVDVTNFVLSAQRYNPVWPPSSVKFYAKADNTWSYLGGFNKGSVAWEGGINMSYSLDNHIASKEIRIEIGGGTLVAGDGQTYSAYALELSFTGQQITSIVEITEAEYEANKDNSDYYKVDGVAIKNHIASQKKYLNKKKIIETPWTQPVLTSNGTLGGDSFAVQMLNNPVNPAWQAFNDSADGARITSGANTDSSYTRYNPNPLKISKIVIDATGHNNNEYIKSGNLYGSNNGTNWTLIKSFSGLSYSASTITVNSDTFYKYHKIQPLTFTSTGYWFMKSITIIATQQTRTWQECTKEEYDNSLVYYKKIETTFNQPVLTSDGTLGGGSFAVEKVGDSYNGDAYQTFDGSTSTAFRPYVNNGLIFYNPNPLNITNFACNVAYANEGILKGELYVSNDNSTWKLINNNIGGAQTWSTNINMQGRYKYFKLMSTSVTGGRGSVAELIITATEQTWQECTKEEYNLLPDSDRMLDSSNRKIENRYIANSRKKYSNKKTVEKAWTQPIMSSSSDNGTLGGNKFACTLEGAVSGYGNPYVLFNGSGSASVTGTTAFYGSASAIITLYNPAPLNITQLTLQQGGSNANGGLHSGTIYGSNDGSNWVHVADYSGLTANAGLITEYINLHDNVEFYKYYQIRNTTGGTHGVVLSEITITATQKVEAWQECTKEEYNDSLGGDSFAVQAASNTSGSYHDWQAFDGNMGTWWISTANNAPYIFYNPVPLCIYTINVKGGSFYYKGTYTKVTLAKSDDGNSWVDVKTYTVPDSNTDDILEGVGNSESSKYWRLTFVGDGSYISIKEITLTATQLTWQQCTKEEYDLLPDSDRMLDSSNRKIENRYYAGATTSLKNMSIIKEPVTDYVTVSEGVASATAVQKLTDAQALSIINGEYVWTQIFNNNTGIATYTFKDNIALSSFSFTTGWNGDGLAYPSSLKWEALVNGSWVSVYNATASEGGWGGNRANRTINVDSNVFSNTYRFSIGGYNITLGGIPYYDWIQDLKLNVIKKVVR